MPAAPAPTMLAPLERLAAWLRLHPRRVERAALVVVFFLALAYRLDGLPRPLVDHHSWRQCDTAAIARNYVEEDACILHPRIDWRGLESGEVEWNFPLFSYAVSLLYRAFGVHDVLGRLLSIACSMAALGVFFVLVRRKHGAGVALWAAAYFALNPLAVYFGRAFMPESLLVLAGLTFLLAVDRWAERGSPGSLALATGALAAAGLVKLPFGFLVLPAAGLVVERRGVRGLLDYRLWTGGAVALIAVVAWYVYARGVGARTGLSFAPIWDIGQDKWGSAGLLASIDFWRTLGERFWSYVTPAGLSILAVAGIAAVAWRALPLWQLLFAIGAAAYLLLIAAGHHAHTYYQIAFVPLAAVVSGVAVEHVVRKLRVCNLRFRILGGLAVAALALTGLQRGNETLRRMHAPRANFVAMGASVARLTSPGDRIITVGSCCLPEAFYFSHRKGWSAMGVTDPQEWVPARIAEGARAAVLLTAYSHTPKQLVCDDPLAAWLAGRFAVWDRGKNFVVLDLESPRPPAPGAGRPERGCVP